MIIKLGPGFVAVTCTPLTHFEIKQFYHHTTNLF